MSALDLVLRNGTVVFPGRQPGRVDIGIADGRIAVLANRIETPAKRAIDATGKLIFPGIVDSHFHLGIFRPMPEDALNESLSAVAGGVTTTLVYYRAGRNNLFEDTAPSLPRPYAELLPEILGQVDGRFRCDYGFHLAPVTSAHVNEIPDLVGRLGVTTFKYYMHYRGVYPGEERRAGEKEFVFSDSGYDLGHLKAMMEAVAGVARTGVPARVSVHAEHPALIREHTRRVKADASLKDLRPLQLYSRSRPPAGERLGIAIVAELAASTGCPVNVLHVSSADALSAIREARERYPELDLMAESTVHHLSLSSDELTGTDAKVNPPIRTAMDRDRLWDAVARDEVQTAVSDHAAISHEAKGADIWSAWYGFGGTELLMPALFTKGHLQRGVPLGRIAEVLSRAPARYHGLSGRKGDVAIGHDADLAICDPSTPRTVDHRELHSAQDFSPFDGQVLRGWVTTTILRGDVVYDSGAAVGAPAGRYIARPV